MGQGLAAGQQPEGNAFFVQALLQPLHGGQHAVPPVVVLPRDQVRGAHGHRHPSLYRRAGQLPRLGQGEGAVVQPGQEVGVEVHQVPDHRRHPEGQLSLIQS